MTTNTHGLTHLLGCKVDHHSTFLLPSVTHSGVKPIWNIVRSCFGQVLTFLKVARSLSQKDNIQPSKSHPLHFPHLGFSS